MKIPQLGKVQMQGEIAPHPTLQWILKTAEGALWHLAPANVGVEKSLEYYFTQKLPASVHGRFFREVFHVDSVHIVPKAAEV